MLGSRGACACSCCACCCACCCRSPAAGCCSLPLAVAIAATAPPPASRPPAFSAPPPALSTAEALEKMTMPPASMALQRMIIGMEARRPWKLENQPDVAGLPCRHRPSHRAAVDVHWHGPAPHLATVLAAAVAILLLNLQSIFLVPSQSRKLLQQSACEQGIDRSGRAVDRVRSGE